MENNDSFFGSHGCPKDTPFKIYISSSKSEQPDFPNASSPQCVRCGSEMKGFQSVFVTIYPPLVQPKSNKSDASSDSDYSNYSLSKTFHISKENVVVNSDDEVGNHISLSSLIPDSKVCCPSCKNVIALAIIDHKPSLSCDLNTNNHAADYCGQDPNDSYESSSENNSFTSVSSCSCRFHTPRSSNDESNDGTSTDLTNDSISQESQCGDNSYDSVSNVDSPKHRTMENTIWNDRPRAFEILTDTSVTPCKDCHVAVEDTRTESNDGLEIVSLMFQISNNSDYMQSYQWEYECPPPLKVDVAVRVDSLGFIPEMIVDFGK